MNTSLAKKHDRNKMVMTVAFTVICIIYVLPILPAASSSKTSDGSARISASVRKNVPCSL